MSIHVVIFQVNCIKKVHLSMLVYPITVHKLLHFKAHVTYKVKGFKMLSKHLLIITF